MKTDVFTVVSTMKNEAPFILDWVAHYKTLGFDNILVCTNDCEDPTVEMLLRLQELGLVVHHPTEIWERAGIQRSALRQAWKRYDIVNQADWVFVCDADEYLNIHMGDGSARALVAGSGPDIDAISVPWRIFGAQGIETFEDVPVTQQFHMAEAPWDPVHHPASGKFGKAMVSSLPRLKRLGVHIPYYQDDYAPQARYVRPGGSAYVGPEDYAISPPVFTHAQVNHYIVRSLESFLIKKARGRVNHANNVMGIEYWQRWNKNVEPDTSIQRYKEASASLASDLKADPVLGELHAKAVDWYRQKVAELRKDPDVQAMIAAIQTGPQHQAVG